MHLLLVTDALQKGQFIAQGLLYENLSTDLVRFAEIRNNNFPRILSEYDGFFLYFENILYLQSLLEVIFQYHKDEVVFLLAHSFQPLYLNLYEQKKIKRFFIRPFPFRLIASEMRSSIFQHREKIQNGILKIRELELDRDAHEMRLCGETIYLRHKEFALLEYLMLNPGKVLSRGNILENVWDRNTNILTNTVDVHINQLRKKIEIYPTSKFIKTIPCTGYIFS